MADYLFPPPLVRVLPVSLGADIIVDFKNRVPGSNPVAYVDYPSNIGIDLVIGEGASKITSAATISTYHAVCRVESSVVDTLKDGALWACIVHVEGIPQSDDMVPINGTLERNDGAT
jgi:hypothetical protein